MPRIVGKSGSIYLAAFSFNGTFPATAFHIGDVFNWELEIIQALVPCGIKGQSHEDYAVGEVTSRVTGERFVQNVAQSTVPPYASLMTQKITDLAPYTGVQGSGTQPALYGHNVQLPRTAIDSSGTTPGPYSGQTVAFQLWAIDDQTFGTGVAPIAGAVIKGEGFLQRVTHKNPRPMDSEQFEITCITMPVVVN